MDHVVMAMTPTPQNTIAIAKFSFATTSYDYTLPIPWTHLVSNNSLFAIFEICSSQISMNSQTQNHRFKILDGREILEDINIAVLARAAKQAAWDAAALGLTRKNPEVAIIIKSPCIAMKYPTNEGQTRRFQIRFAATANYFEAVSIFQKAGVPTIDAVEQRPANSHNSIYGIPHPSALMSTQRLTVPPPPSLTNPGQLYQGNHYDATRNSRSIQTSYAPSQAQFVPDSGIASTHQGFVVDHQGQQSVATILNHQPSHISTTHPGTRLSNFGSSAPLPILQDNQARDNSYRLPPSTAPVHWHTDSENDLPPERSLPFPLKQGKSVTSKDTKGPATTRKEAEAYHRAVTNLSEHSPDLPGPGTTKRKVPKCADDIDTQLLLAKVKARKLNSSKLQKLSAGPAAGNHKTTSQSATTSKKPRRNIRCLQCRGKRCKCERNSEDSDGTCVPCLNAGQKCSFTPDIDVGPQDAKPKQSNVQVPNSQEEISQVSQPVRVSLRQSGVPSLSDTNEEEVISQQGIKRPSQIAMPAPKRVKRAKEAHKVSIAQNVIAETPCRGSLPQLRTPLKLLAQPCDTIRSDATTMTATTLDLDPVSPVITTIRPAKPPKQLIVSLPYNKCKSQPDQDNPQGDTAQSLSNTIVSTTKPIEYHQATSATQQEQYETFMTSDLHAFLELDTEEQDTMLSAVFSIALESPDFLTLLNNMDHRWETTMFNGTLKDNSEIYHPNLSDI